MIRGADRYVFDSRDVVTSTNDLLKEKAVAGEKEGYVITAKAQTAGKGRKGRSFYSHADNAVYMSVLLRPRLDIKDSLLITTAAAVSVCRAIEMTCNKKAGIKWVNDIFIDNRKVCGILAEAAIGGNNSDLTRLDYVILGIGINVFPIGKDIPDDIKNVAGSIYGESESASLNEVQKNSTREKLILNIVDEFFKIYDSLPDRKFMNEYRNKSVVIGKDVGYLEGGIPSGIIHVDDIDDDGHLIAYKAGERLVLDSGEVSIRL